MQFDNTTKSNRQHDCKNSPVLVESAGAQTARDRKVAGDFFDKGNAMELQHTPELSLSSRRFAVSLPQDADSGWADVVEPDDKGYPYQVATVWSAKERNVGAVQLFAAAPDLLAALEGVVRVADRKTVEFDAARAAIAKAKGGAS